MKINYELQVVFHSKRSPNNFLFHANLKNETSRPIIIPRTDKNGVNYTDSARFRNGSSFSLSPNSAASILALPSNGFRYTNFKLKMHSLKKIYYHLNSCR